MVFPLVPVLAGGITLLVGKDLAETAIKSSIETPEQHDVSSISNRDLVIGGVLVIGLLLTFQKVGLIGKK